MAKKLAYDRVLFTTVILLVGLGLVMVYSASAAVARGRGATFNPFLVRQAAAAALGLLVMAVVMHVDYRKLRDRRVVYALVAGVLFLLVAVLFSPQLNATRRWFFIAGISVQPSELSKLALVPFLAFFIDRRKDAVNTREVLWPAAIVTGLLAGLILLQPDLGTAVLLVSTAALMLFLAGLSWRFVVASAAIALPVLYLLVISVPYRRARLFTFLEPERDPLGAGFQAMQSLIAVGSGGLFGLGPGNSLQKLYFLPHPESDFIYAIVAEELGLIGALAVRGALRTGALAGPPGRLALTGSVRALPRLGILVDAGDAGADQHLGRDRAPADQGHSTAVPLLWRLVAGGHHDHLRRPAERVPA